MAIIDGIIIIRVINHRNMRHELIANYHAIWIACDEDMKKNVMV